MGYITDPVAILERVFEESDGYDEMVVLEDIEFVSRCEHHLAPIIGRAHIGYLPRIRVVGISKLARLVDVYAKRLQLQERMTAQIAAAIDRVLRPHGVAVVIEAMHHCISARGVGRPHTLVTSRMLGEFRSDHYARSAFVDAVASRRVGR
jgi:GTP cyclohydrolase I